MVPDEIERILDLCIDLMRKDGESIESILARYPGLEAPLRARLEAAAWLEEQTSRFEPRPGFIARSRQEMDIAIQQAVGQSQGGGWAEGLGYQEAAQARRPRRARAKAAHRSGWPRILSFGLALILLACLLLGGTGAALASRQALPGDRLYGVKLAVEQVELAAARDVPAEARLQIRFVQRRLVEVQSLALTERFQAMPGTVGSLDRQVEAAVKSIETLLRQDPQEAGRLASVLRETLAEQSVQVDRLADAASQEARPGLAEALEIAALGMAASEAILEEVPAAASTLAAPLSGAAEGEGEPTSGSTGRLGPAATPEPPDGGAPGKPTSGAGSGGSPGQADTPKPTKGQPPPGGQPTSTRLTTATPPAPTGTLQPTKTPKPPDGQKPTRETQPTKRPKPTKEPKATQEPRPPDESKPSQDPKPTKEPKPQPPRGQIEVQKPANPVMN